MLRKDYLNAEYTSEDKKLIALFQKQMQKINQLFQAALQEWDKTKALLHLRKMQAISTALKAEYGERAELRIPQEYLKGEIYIDDYLNKASSLSRLKNQWDNKLIMSRVAQLGPVHTEAVKALMENSKMLVSASIDGMEKYALTMLTKHQQSQAKIKLAEWVLSWDWLEKMKKNLTKVFENNGVVKFQDRAGRMRDMNRYVDMLTRTETKIANTQGTINRALESGVSKFEVVEHEDCCEICAEHNGKIYDISKWAVELPPYHPNCKGYIIPVVDTPESRFGMGVDLKVKSLAEKVWITGKNTLERMKKLNKYVKTPEGKKFKKTVYRLKDDIILSDIKKKGEVLNDKWSGMTYKLTQSGVQVNWHLGDFRKTLKKLWRIKKQE